MSKSTISTFESVWAVMKRGMYGVYSKDLNGDSLDRLTPELLADLGIVLDISEESED